MAGIVYPVPKPERFTCETCGMTVVEVRNHSCAHCGMIAYLNFRHAFDWPLDEADMIRLGLKPAPTKETKPTRRKNG